MNVFTDMQLIEIEVCKLGESLYNSLKLHIISSIIPFVLIYFKPFCQFLGKIYLYTYGVYPLTVTPQRCV